MKSNKKMIAAVVLATLSILGSQVVRAEDADAPKVYYKDGLHIDAADGNNSLLLNGRFQGRYTYTSLEKASNTNTFAVQRGEIRLEGNVYKKQFKYAFEMGFATRAAATTATVCTNAACTTTAAAVTTPSTTGLPLLNDYYLDWVPTDAIGVKVGQFKVPYLYTELVSAMKQEYPDRSLINDNLTFGRDIGANVHGSLLNYHLNYNAFVMNGDGQNVLNAGQRALLIGTRIEVPIFGAYKYAESDVDYTEEPSLGVGLGYVFNKRNSAFEASSIAAKTNASHGTLDVVYRSHGLYLQGAGMVSRTHQKSPSITNWGYSAQAGYFILPKRFEVTARAGGLILNKALVNQYEYGAGLGYYFNKHNLKLQMDYALLQNVRGLNLNDHRVRTQVTVVF